MVAIAAPLIPLGITGARVAGPYIANLARQYGPMAMKGLINLMSKKDDDEKITTIDQEGNVLPDLPDQMPEPNEEDPNKKTTIRPLSPKEIAKKLAEEGLGQVIDKGVEKLQNKYEQIDEQKKFELEQADPADLDSTKTITETPDAKGKLIEVGGETTEGMFKHKGQTYNKSDGVRIEYYRPDSKRKIERIWIPKTVYGQPKDPPRENVKTKHVADTVSEINKIFPNQNLHEITGPEMLDILRQNGYDTTLSTIFTAKNKIMGRGPTSEENKAKKILDPEGYEAVDAGKSLSRLDKKTYDQSKNFLTEISPNKLEKDILNKHLQRMVYFAKREGASDAEILESLNNVDKEKLTSLLNNVGELRALNKQLRDLGINPMVQNKPYAINLSHKLPVKKDWRKAFDPDNLFVSDSYGNLILQPSLEKQIKDIKDGLKNYKTLTEKKQFLKESMPGFQGDQARTIKEVRQAFKDNRLISIFGDKIFGSPNPNDPYFIEQMRDTLLKRLETGKFKKDGGMVGISHLVRPL